MRVLIFGLPGTGKTYLASRIKKYLGDNAEHFNADKVRAEANDWDFSDKGRQRQATRMTDLVTKSVSNGKIAIADFIAPFRLSRQQFDADYKVWVDTCAKSEYANTDAIFEKPTIFGDSHEIDYRVQEKDFNKDAIRIAWQLGERFYGTIKHQQHKCLEDINHGMKDIKHCLIEQWLNMDRCI